MLDTKVKYKNLFNNKLNAMAYCQIVVDLKGNPIDYIFLEVNKTFEKLTGLKKKAIINRKVTDAIPNFFRSEASFINICGKVALSGEEATFEKHFEAYKEGPEKWYSFFVYSPKKGFFVSISSDITKRKKSEEDLRQLNIELEKRVGDRTKKLAAYNRALSMLSLCNEHMVYASGENELLKKICKIIVENGKYKVAWVGSIEHDKEKSVRPIAQLGFNDGYLDSLNLSWSKNNPRGLGPTGTAVRNKKFSIGRYFSNDKNLSVWKEEALKRGFLSSIALPLKSKRKVFGVLNIYSSSEDAFNKDEVDLLSRLADDLAFGIMTIRLRKEHRDSEESLKASNILLKLSNSSSSRKKYLDMAVRQIKSFSRCDYLGIRILKEDGFVPFESFSGYSKDFLKSENFISIKSEKCSCAMVIFGKFNLSDKEPITKGGSFFIENIPKFVSDLPKKERKKFRGKCFNCGFGSLAIVPIRSKEKIIGAIHVAGKKVGSITADKVDFLESLTSLIGEAIEKFNASEKVIQSEEKYRELVENANSMIVRVDSRGNIVFFNEFAEKFFGYSSKDILGRNIIGTIFPEKDSSGTDLKEMVDDMLVHPYRYIQIENESMRKNGERVWISWNNKPIFDKSKRLVGLLLIGSDITDRKRKEEMLLESYKHMGTINRKISLLLELDQLPYKYRGNKKRISEAILASLMNISSANSGIFFAYNEEDEIFKVIVSKGIDNEKVRRIGTVPVKGCKTLRIFVENKIRIQGLFKDHDFGKEKIDDGSKYFVVVPVLREGSLKGALFLRFNERRDFSGQEIEFFDVFSTHATSTLASVGMFK